MDRFIHMVVLSAFLSLGFGVPMTLAGEPTPAEQKDKKDMTGGKAEEEKKGEKKDMGGKLYADEEKKDDKKGMGGK